jgi:hypothetical protein
MAKTDRNNDDNTMLEALEERIHRTEGIIINVIQESEENSEEDDVKSFNSVPGITRIKLNSRGSGSGKTEPKEDGKSSKKTESVKSCSSAVDVLTRNDSDEDGSKKENGDDSAEESGTENDDDSKKEESGTEDLTKDTEGNPHDAEDHEGRKSTTSKKGSSSKKSSSSKRSQRSNVVAEDEVFTDRTEDDGRKSNTSKNSQDSQSKKSQDSLSKKTPARSPSEAILKKNVEEAKQDEEEDSKTKATASAIDTFTTPKSKMKILQENLRLEKERPAQVHVSPAGTTLHFKNATQQSIRKYGTETPSQRKRNKSRAKSSMPILRSNSNLPRASSAKDTSPTKID